MKRLAAIALLLLSSVAHGQTTKVSELTATWNNGGTVFRAIGMDITDTASAAGSSALWLGFAGTEVFRVDSNGTIYNSAVAMPTISSTSTLTNKTIAFGSNTVTGTAAQFDTAVTDDDFAFVSDNLSVFAATTSAQLAGVLSDETGSGLAVFGTSPVLTLPQINDTSSDHQYVFGVSELIADRTVTLPLLTGNGTFVFEAHAATLTNKTIVAANNSMTLFAGGANNQLLTDDGSGGLVSESGLIYDGTNFGIGATPSAQLDITAATSVVGLNIDLDATPASAITITDSGSNVLFVVDGTGQTGIGAGASTPEYLLSLADSVDNSATVNDPNDSTADGPVVLLENTQAGAADTWSGLAFGGVAGVDRIWQQGVVVANNDLYWRIGKQWSGDASLTEWLRINSSGELAINNTTPNALLDVRGDAGAAGILELSTAETTIVDGDELGRINFRAPDEASGTDAVLVGAAIYAEADATFSASVNTTDLVFATGNSETATEKMRLDSDGKLGIGIIPGSAFLNVSRTFTGSSQYGVDVRTTLNDSTHASTSSLNFINTASHSSGAVSTRGLLGQVTSNASGTGTGNTYTGISGVIRHNSANSVTEHKAIEAGTSLFNGAGTVSRLIGFNADLRVTTGATVTNFYGFRVDDVAHTGTVTNAYGYYIDPNYDSTGATNIWGVYVDSDVPSYFEGKVGILNNAPSAQLDITAAASTIGLNVLLDATPASAITVSPDGGGLPVFAVESNGESVTVRSSVLSTAEGGTARYRRRSAHETHTLTLGATSDTTTISVPSGARLLGVSMNVNTVVVDDAGDDTWDATWITGSSQNVVTGASPTLNTKVHVMFPGNIDDVTTATTQIRFTPNGGNFSAGVIEVVAYFEELTSLANL